MRLVRNPLDLEMTLDIDGEGGEVVTLSVTRLGSQTQRVIAHPAAVS